MTDTEERMNPLHFGSDPADIQILWINPKIWIWISDHFRLKFGRRWRFALCYKCKKQHFVHKLMASDRFKTTKNHKKMITDRPAHRLNVSRAVAEYNEYCYCPVSD